MTVQEAKEDFKTFCNEIETSRNYKLSSFHYDMVDYLFETRFPYIKSPRGHLKTTLFSILYPLWRIKTSTNWKNEVIPQVKICQVSSALDQSWKTMFEVQDIILMNDELKRLANKRWSRNQINFRNGSQYFVKPYNDTIRGTHVDFFICDDILRTEKITQQQIKDLFWGTIFPTVQTRNGQLIVVGTAMTLDDLFCELADNPEWKGRTFQAIQEDSNGKWSNPLWPERFTVSDLEKLRGQMGNIMFSREYLNNPLGSGVSLFPMALLQRQTENKYLDKPDSGGNYYLGVDVALSSGVHADWTVFTVLEEKDKIFHIVRFDRFQSDDQNNMINKIKEWNNIFNFKKVMIDKKGLGQGLEKMAMYDDILKHITEGFVTTKESKLGIISHIEGAMTSGKLFIPDYSQLYRELNAFGIKKDNLGHETLEGLGEHDDCVISLALAYEAATNKKGSYSIELIM